MAFTAFIPSINFTFKVITSSIPKFVFWPPVHIWLAKKYNLYIKKARKLNLLLFSSAHFLFDVFSSPLLLSFASAAPVPTLYLLSWLFNFCANPHPLSSFAALSSCVCADLLYFSGGSNECRDRDAEIMRAVCRRAGLSLYDCPCSCSPCYLTLSMPTESSES